MTRAPFHHAHVRGPGAVPRGMTLVELVASASILSVVVLAMGSSVLIATRAAEISAAGQTSSASDLTGRIAADLQTAMAFTERTATAATFTVPDRDGDGRPETLRYAWSGMDGDPLTLAYNGGLAVAIAEDVRGFDLSYLLRTVPAAGPLPPQESEEMVLISHIDVPGAGTLNEYQLSDRKWAGAYFIPDLPPNAISWKITRVQFLVRQAGGGENDILVQIRSADTDKLPTGAILETQALPASSLPTDWTWTEVPFATVQDLDPTQGACLVMGQAPGMRRPSAQMRWEGDLTAITTTPNTHYVSSGDGGAGWRMKTPDYKADLLFYIYGTVTTQ